MTNPFFLFSEVRIQVG